MFESLEINLNKWESWGIFIISHDGDECIQKIYNKYHDLILKRKRRFELLNKCNKNHMKSF